MKRLFTFGCSFTNYYWSTWADCLAPEFDYFENWGQSGGGNQYIFNSVIEADQRHKFGPNDTVVICWTNVLRDDRYVFGKWVTLGSVFNTPIYTKEFIDQHVDPRGYLIRDIALIKATKNLLENKPEVRWKFISMVPLTLADVFDDRDLGDTDIVDLYKDVLDSMLPSYLSTLRPKGWCLSSPKWPNFGYDDHPSPLEHLEYLDTVLPGWVTKTETRVKIQQEQHDLSTGRLNKRSGMTKVTRL